MHGKRNHLAQYRDLTRFVICANLRTLDVLIHRILRLVILRAFHPRKPPVSTETFS